MKYEVALFELAIVKDLCLTISLRTSGVMPSHTQTKRKKKKNNFRNRYEGIKCFLAYYLIFKCNGFLTLWSLFVELLLQHCTLHQVAPTVVEIQNLNFKSLLRVHEISFSFIVSYSFNFYALLSPPKV